MQVKHLSSGAVQLLLQLLCSHLRCLGISRAQHAEGHSQAQIVIGWRARHQGRCPGRHCHCSREEHAGRARVRIQVHCALAHLYHTVPGARPPPSRLPRDLA